MTLENQRKKLADWLQAWQVETALAQDAGEETAHCDGPCVAGEISGEPEPTAGQIRLWPAKGSAMRTADLPFYALVLPEGYGTWRVVPFSTLSVPATPGEFRVLDTGPAQVLQGWNVRTLRRAGISHSWWVADLEERHVFAVLGWLTWLGSVAFPLREVPPELQPGWHAQCGPPLLHPKDLRHEYMAREWSRVGRALGEWEAGGVAVQLDLAAEPPPTWPADPET